MPDRRELLKIIGAIGTTCAFPFPAAQLYGQHVQLRPQPTPAPPGPYQPRFFTETEYRTVSIITDLIIPPTDTPGAVAAGVPQYIDDLVRANTEHQNAFREGIKWLDQQSIARFSKAFAEITGEQQMELLTPLSEAVDRIEARRFRGRPSKAMGRAAHSAPSQNVGEHFFQMIKGMTADGYYTSHTGLIQELGYKGNTMLAQFPECTMKE